MVGEQDLGLSDLPCLILTIYVLTEFQHLLSGSERIPEDKGEPESQFLINVQRVKRNNKNGIHCRGHVVHEEIALDKTEQGETSKCLLPVNPISALVISQRLIISGELCYINPQTIFPNPLGPANILYYWDNGLLCHIYPYSFSLFPILPSSSQGQTDVATPSSLWDSHS